MDLILISDLTKKLSSIFFYKKNKDIRAFIEDPLSLELTHLENIIKINKVLVGGAPPATAPAPATPAPATPTPAVPAVPAAVPDATTPTPSSPAPATPTPATPAPAVPAVPAVPAAVPDATAPAPPVGDGAETVSSAVAGGGGDRHLSIASLKNKLDINKNMMSTIDKDPIENPFYKLLEYLTKMLLYPLLFIFMIIFPYIYVTMKSFKKLTKLYRNNVLSM